MELGGAVSLGPLALGQVGLGVLGGAWGLAADRLAARWPAKASGRRAIDWRTVVVALSGAVALGVLGLRFAAEPLGGLVLGVYVLALVVLLATDLDQRLLPDVVTLPLVGYALVLDLGGWNPLLGEGSLLSAVGAAVLYPALLYLLSVPLGAGALGLGDVKLLVSAGLLLGLGRGLVALLAGAIAAGAAIAILLVARRITLRSYVPFGPFLVFGIVWAILAPG